MTGIYKSGNFLHSLGGCPCLASGYGFCCLKAGGSGDPLGGAIKIIVNEFILL